MNTRILAGLLLAAIPALGQEFHVGGKISDFSITGSNGAAVNFASLRGDTTVVIFVSARCPVSNGYNERMQALYDDYAAKGVKFVFINANVNEPLEEVAQHAKQHSFTFPVYKDSENRVSDRFGATVTPETFVIDRSGAIRYHGYIDDSLKPAGIHKQGLRMALDAVLAGKDVPVTETKAFGCTIKRGRRVS